jgi:DNA-directed RNA polymerase subunit K
MEKIASAPQTYIKGPHFRGYLYDREDADLKYTRFEKARIIGARALQISLGAPILIEASEDIIDPITISIMEYEKGVIPMTVKRET